eukprot:2285154-Ditylum_brightwellii.AAC.1
MVYKYGVEVPRNVGHAIKLDKENNNTMWQDAMTKEVGRRKAQLIACGHLIVLLDHNVYLPTVKGISVHLLHVLAHSAKLDDLCGDIGNAYVNAYTTEK